MTYWNLPRMPGPLDESVNFIVNFLQELKRRKTMTRTQVVGWGAKAHDGVSEQFLIQAVQLLAVVELCSESKTNDWRLKPLGHEFLVAKQSVDQHRLLAKQLVLKIRGVREILEICADAGGQPLTNLDIERRMTKFQFDRPVRVPERTEGLRMCKFLEMVSKGRLLITPLGVEINDMFPMDHALARATSLVNALKRAALDSEHTKIFEEVVRQCFEFLGFIVTPLGDRGDTDNLIEAPLGFHSYSAIVDAKTSLNGRVENWNAPNIAQHKKKHQVSSAMVVAYDFDRNASGLRDAAEKGIVLVTAEVLQSLLEMHAETPLSTNTYEALFKSPGLLEQVPDTILSVSERTRRAATLLLDVFETLSKVPATTPIPTAQLRWLLLGRTNYPYNEQETEQAIQFLAYPILGAIYIDEKQQVYINMSRRTLHAALRQLALKFSEG